MPSEFLMLPVELQIVILQFCRPQDMLACHKTCKALHSLIHGDLELKYQYELALSGMVDGFYRDIPVNQCIDALREYRAAWDSGNHPVISNKLPSHATHYFSSGSLFACTHGRRNLLLYRPPAKFCGVQARKDVIPGCGLHLGPPRRMRCVAIDYSQELLVVSTIEQRDCPKCTLLWLKDLSSPHPDAAECILHADTPSYWVVDSSVQVFDELLAFSIHSRNGSEILVWNWKTGVLIWHYDGRIEWTCLKLYNLDPRRSRGAPLASLKRFVCQLELPPLKQAAYALRPIKEWDGNQYVLRNDIERYVLLIPVGTILGECIRLGARATPSVVPWNDWGPSGTRMLELPQGITSEALDDFPDRDVFDTMGAKLCFKLTTKDGLKSVTVVEACHIGSGITTEDKRPPEAKNTIDISGAVLRSRCWRNPLYLSHDGLMLTTVQ
ncbi:hypothetical protein BV20DRAFT_1111402 [Pilatotrama ljubarskyi]|nr:hypothetical protein BV20DRAFT_1111402 [Pilatotrama ljubarskyi]